MNRTSDTVLGAEGGLAHWPNTWTMNMAIISISIFFPAYLNLAKKDYSCNENTTAPESLNDK